MSSSVPPERQRVLAARVLPDDERHDATGRDAARGVQREAEQFLYREARLLDERRFADWEALWTEDGVYWVPATHEPYDPLTRVSLAYDDRATLAKRVARLMGPDSHAEHPPPMVRRIVSNVEVVEHEPRNRLVVESNFVAVSSRRDRTETFAGRSTHELVRDQSELRISFKKVVLVNCDGFLAHLPFLP